MKSRLMKLALAVAALFVMCGASLAQSPSWGQQRDHDGYWGYQNRDRDRDGVDDRYEVGVRDGRSDREHHRAWNPRHPGAAYMNGYRAGYGTGWQGGRNDNDRGRDYRGPYGNVPGGYGNQNKLAYNNGYQQGLRYGEEDRRTGHSNRPTYSSTYQNGSSGYSSSYGSKSDYKHAFQDGFRAGYERGYNSGIRR
jgi:hypothetical protein